jgi:hypothetical protein
METPHLSRIWLLQSWSGPVKALLIAWDYVLVHTNDRRSRHSCHDFQDVGSWNSFVRHAINQFFVYRREPLAITAISAQIVVLPLGQLMAATITREKVFHRE